MAKVTGFLNDFQLGHLADQHPTIVFQPSGPAVGGADLFAPEYAVTVPVGGTGYFEAELQPTDTLRPAVFYRVLLQWGSGQRAKLPWKLRVPSAGGVLAELLQVGGGAGQAWVGAEPPPNPEPGLWWLNPETGELSEWSN